MSKIEVLATSFILTLTVISTAPLQSADLQWSLDYFNYWKQKTNKEQINFTLKNTPIIQYQKFIYRETFTFSLSNTIDSISRKSIGKSWNLSNLYWRGNLLKKNDFIPNDNVIQLVSYQPLKHSNLNLIQTPSYHRFPNQIILPKSDFQLFSREIWNRQKTNGWIEEQKVWNANLQNIKTLKTKSRIIISTDPLPIISLVIASLFCFVFSKSPKVS